MKAPVARHGRRHDAEAALAELRLGVAVEPQRHLVEPVHPAAPAINAVVVRAEVQQHGLLDPLMRDPRAVDLFGDAQRARGSARR